MSRRAVTVTVTVTVGPGDGHRDGASAAAASLTEPGLRATGGPGAAPAEAGRHGNLVT
jgi:hypothetical protein